MRLFDEIGGATLEGAGSTTITTTTNVKIKWRHRNRCGGILQSLPIKMLHDSCLNDSVLSVSRKRCQISVSQMTDGKDET